MNKITLKQVNNDGLNYIKKILGAHHRKGRFTDAEVLAWAQEVEQNLADHNIPTFEISTWDSVSGRPEVFTIPASCIDEVAGEHE